jgi:hypothetical protein
MSQGPLTCVSERGLRVPLNISLSKLEHVAVNLLRLSGKTECLQERAESINEPDVTEVDHVNKGMHRCNVDVVADGDQRYE